MPYNSDMFATRKDVHIRIRTQNYAPFRVELMKRKLSMQEVFDELAAMVTRGEPSAIKFLDRIVYNKNREKIERMLRAGHKPTKFQEKRLQKNTTEVIPADSHESFLDFIERVTPLKSDGDET